MASLVRKAVSSDRRRYRDDGFDLDLTYITKRMLAMGFPATGMEGVYRNHIDDVASFLDTHHRGNYMIYNLSGRGYDGQKFHENVLDFGWPDHHSPSLSMLFDIIHSMDAWLKADTDHVVVVHCVAGKGRTGTVLSAYLIYSGAMESSDEALDYFARMRSERAIGVQHPSQKRCVHYFENAVALSRIRPPPPKPMMLTRIIIHGVPLFDQNQGGCSPLLHVLKAPYMVKNTEHAETLYRSSWTPTPVSQQSGRIIFSVNRVCKEDVLVRLYHCPPPTFSGGHANAKLMFRFSFNTYFEPTHMFFNISGVDVPNDSKHLVGKRFPQNFLVEVFLDDVDDEEASQRETLPDRVNVRKEGWLICRDATQNPSESRDKKSRPGAAKGLTRRRWCVLSDNHIFSYRQKGEARGGGIVSLERVQVEGGEGTSRCFLLRTEGKLFELFADTHDIMLSWVAAIERSKDLFEAHLSNHTLRTNE